jgi:hypothetical protein
VQGATARPRQAAPSTVVSAARRRADQGVWSRLIRPV